MLDPRRIFAATATVGVLLLVIGATAVSAAPPLASAMSSEGYEATREWCDDRGTTSECTRVDAVVVATTNPDGRRTVAIAVREVVSAFTADGTEIEPARATSYERTVFSPSSEGLSFTVSLGPAADTGSTCVRTLRLDVVGYELRLGRLAGRGC